MTSQRLHAPLIIDVAGTYLNDADRRRLANPLVGGVIHFARNWQDRAQLCELNAEIKALRPDMLICVDQEGGRVQRFKSDGFTRLPAMRSIGELWMSDPLRATRMATACGFVLGSELRACGVDLSFAPVLDLDHGASGVIGDRSFHRDPRVVALLAKSLMHGLLQAGMANCGKHFPGHGHVRADSHLEIPVDRRSLKAILSDDAQPYEWLLGPLTAVMPAHIIFSKVDSRPAGFSRRWLQEILRGKLGFDGAIFSDDLNMEAARHIDGERVSYLQAVLTALDAGCDLALLCNRSIGDEPVLDEVLEGLAEAERSGHWRPETASERRRHSLVPRVPALDWEDLISSNAYRSAIELLRMD
ncbi:MAG: beta-N-acetylhexosaminidase [Gammaproteobacteria bacterium]|nr:beta-N-acetylhexosaminidase [Gammaproteobacteria bacterium]MBU1441858.1 beta-N-acetylhexosaminidase [Gammaproteobacteria bacterium]MBU2287170.1 beta-N-acetylhexosaminidase [Gammaproteobacteria bacterium]MBU2410386.1 beta-N-acetylhexosaminidase [Gammaproteobacteria bacterium]